MKPLILASAAGVGLSPASSMALLMSQNIFTFAGSAATALKVLIAASTWGEAPSTGLAARQATTAAKTTRFIVILLLTGKTPELERSWSRLPSLGLPGAKGPERAFSLPRRRRGEIRCHFQVATVSGLGPG